MDPTKADYSFCGFFLFMSDQTVERNRLIRKTSPFGTLNYSVNPATGEEASITSTNTNGTNVSYGFDALNRPTTLEDGSLTTLFHYDGVGNPVNVTFSNGVTVTQAFDALNRLNAVTVVNNIGVIGSYTYSLGAAGNRTGVSEFTGRNINWTLDDLYRLLNETITGDTLGPNGGVTYAYDGVGNRNTRTSTTLGVASVTFTGGYDPSDRLNPTFNFDANGNQLNDSRGFTYTYNSLNQLTRVQGTGVDVSYVYDGDGLRVQKTNNLTSVVTNYLWDRNNLTGFAQVSEELQNGQVVRRYVYGPRGPLYQVQLVGNTWVTNYFAADATGSIRLVLDDSGNITNTVDYDGFGNVLR